MAAIQQAARPFSEKVTGNQCIRRINDAVVIEIRQGVGGAKRKAKPTFVMSEPPAQLERQSVIEAITYRDQLFYFSAGWVGAQPVKSCEGYFRRRGGGETVEVDKRNRNPKLNYLTYGIGI